MDSHGTITTTWPRKKEAFFFSFLAFEKKEVERKWSCGVT